MNLPLVKDLRSYEGPSAAFPQAYAAEFDGEQMIAHVKRQCLAGVGCVGTRRAGRSRIDHIDGFCRALRVAGLRGARPYAGLDLGVAATLPVQDELGTRGQPPVRRR